MRLADIIRARSNIIRRTSATGSTRHQSVGYKNGRLLVAVVLAFGLMIGLVALNLRLIRHPAVLGSGFKSTEISRSEPKPSSALKAESEPVETTGRNARPEMTFYRDLTSENEQSGASEGSDRAQAKGNDSEGSSQQKPRESGTFRNASKTDDLAGRRNLASAGKFPESPAERGSPSDLNLASKTYTVQVGSFSHPSIAQQWAVNWKARGYDVELRPMARPNTGVTYQLYLGKFRSEKEADELVKRLKAKEGITALRLTVPN